MNLSSNAVRQTVQNYVTQKNYVAAYQTVLNDLQTHYISPTAAQSDVMATVVTGI